LLENSAACSLPSSATFLSPAAVPAELVTIISDSSEDGPVDLEKRLPQQRKQSQLHTSSSDRARTVSSAKRHHRVAPASIEQFFKNANKK
jgi:hypothetical protein